MVGCDSITKGRKLPCLFGTGGIKQIDFAVFDSYNFTIDKKTVTKLGELKEVYRYEVKATTNTFTDTATQSRDSGTSVSVAALAVTLTGLDADTEDQLERMLKSRTIAFAHDYNGNVKVVGIDSGCDVLTMVSQTGGARSDLSGYQLSIQAESGSTSPFLSEEMKTALEAMVSSSVIGEPEQPEKPEDNKQKK